MKDVVFVKQLEGATAEKNANQYLKDGWQLLHVVTNLAGILENGQAEYETIYVVGADQAHYDKYQSDLKDASKVEDEF